MIYKLKKSLTLDAKGIFTGYASLFGKKDLGHDVVLPGAFRESLRKRGTSVRMLYQHNPAEPLGVWQEIKEDRTGLYVKGRLTLNTTRASEVYHLMRSGALDGLSIGFHAIKAKRSARTGTRYLHKIDLWEISIVTFPMQEAARVVDIKRNKFCNYSKKGLNS